MRFTGVMYFDTSGEAQSLRLFDIDLIPHERKSLCKGVDRKVFTFELPEGWNIKYSEVLPYSYSLITPSGEIISDTNCYIVKDKLFTGYYNDNGKIIRVDLPFEFSTEKQGITG